MNHENGIGWEFGTITVDGVKIRCVAPTLEMPLKTKNYLQ